MLLLVDLIHEAGAEVVVEGILDTFLFLLEFTVLTSSVIKI
jgi:hypothetical protein